MIVTISAHRPMSDPYHRPEGGEVVFECAEFRPCKDLSPEWWLVGRWTINVMSNELSGWWREEGKRPPCYCPAHAPDFTTPAPPAPATNPPRRSDHATPDSESPLRRLRRFLGG